MGKVGLAILATGVLPFTYSVIRLNLHRWRALSTDVSLASTKVISPDFKTDLSGIYKLSLLFTDPNHVPRFACMIGDSLYKDCDGVARNLYLRWSVVDNNCVVQTSGIYDARGFTGSIEGQGADLGAFNAKRGHIYHVLLTVDPRSALLQPARPKIVVEAARIYWEGWIIGAQLGFYLAVVFGPIGLMFFGTDLWMHALREEK